MSYTQEIIITYSISTEVDSIAEYLLSAEATSCVMV